MGNNNNKIEIKLVETQMLDHLCVTFKCFIKTFHAQI